MFTRQVGYAKLHRNEDLMKLVHTFLPHSYIAKLDELVAESIYPNRSEAIRFAVRDLLKTHGKWGTEQK